MKKAIVLAMFTIPTLNLLAAERLLCKKRAGGFSAPGEEAMMDIYTLEDGNLVFKRILERNRDGALVKIELEPKVLISGLTKCKISKDNEDAIQCRSEDYLSSVETVVISEERIAPQFTVKTKRRSLTLRSPGFDTVEFSRCE